MILWWIYLYFLWFINQLITGGHHLVCFTFFRSWELNHGGMATEAVQHSPASVEG